MFLTNFIIISAILIAAVAIIFVVVEIALKIEEKYGKGGAYIVIIIFMAMLIGIISWVYAYAGVRII